MMQETEIEAALGIQTLRSPQTRAAMEQWVAAFSGNADRQEQKDGLHLAATICTELARQMTANATVTITGAAALQSLLDRSLPALQASLPAGLACGGMAMLPYVANGCVSLAWTPMQNVFPVAAAPDQSLQSAVFAHTLQRGEAWYTWLAFYDYDRDKQQCRIQNTAYRSDEANTLGNACALSETPWAGLETLVTVQADAPLFGVFRVPKPNCNDPDSVLGVSVFADALPQLLQADTLWAEILWEYAAKEAAVFATQDVVNRLGGLSAHDKRQYAALGEDAAGKLLSYAPEIRDAALFHGLNQVLQRVETSCQLACGTLSEPTAMAASERTLQRQDAFVAALQREAERALRQAMTATATLAVECGVLPDATFEMAVDWGAA